MKVTISVTKEDIKIGEQKSACNCPVARACQRAFPNARFIAVNSLLCIGLPDDTCASVDLPLGVRQWIHAFDNSANVKPFTFELEFSDAD